jgi:hypothetical protein
VDEPVLLTDDEIVALSAVDGRPWPLGLITVGGTADELTQAGLRGIRSLAVRRLIADATEGDRRPDPALARDVAAFISAQHRVGAHIAPAASVDVLAGASITAARITDGWLLDTATADGVHALRRVSPEEAESAVIDFVEAVIGEARAGLVCVLRYGRSGENATVVSDQSAWNPTQVRDAFAAATRP